MGESGTFRGSKRRYRGKTEGRKGNRKIIESSLNLILKIILKLKYDELISLTQEEAEMISGILSVFLMAFPYQEKHYYQNYKDISGKSWKGN